MADELLAELVDDELDAVGEIVVAVDCDAACAILSGLFDCERAATPLHAERSMAVIKTRLAKLITFVFMDSSEIVLWIL